MHRAFRAPSRAEDACAAGVRRSRSFQPDRSGRLADSRKFRPRVDGQCPKLFVQRCVNVQTLQSTDCTVGFMFVKWYWNRNSIGLIHSLLTIQDSIASLAATIILVIYGDDRIQHPVESASMKRPVSVFSVVPVFV